MRKGTNIEADYWAYGVLIFEMLVGEPPFKSLSGDPWDTFRQTLSGRFYVPPNVPPTAADLIYKLLQACLLLQHFESIPFGICFNCCKSKGPVITPQVLSIHALQSCNRKHFKS